MYFGFFSSFSDALVDQIAAPRTIMFEEPLVSLKTGDVLAAPFPHPASFHMDLNKGTF